MTLIQGKKGTVVESVWAAIARTVEHADFVKISLNMEGEELQNNAV